MRSSLWLAVVGLFVSGAAFADSHINYSGKTVSFSSARCMAERHCDGTPARLRIFVGEDQTLQQERLELILPQINEINSVKKGELQLNNPDTDGNVCLRSFDDARETPKHRAFCLARLKGNDSCRVNYSLQNEVLKVSLSCHQMRRATNPSIRELLDFEVPASNPIECNVIDAGIPAYCTE